MKRLESRNRVFVVDDHPVIRETLSAFIERIDDLEICGTATSGDEALTRIVACRCDLVLVDLSMPGMSGIDLVRRLQEQKPECRCLILSGHSEQVYVRDSLEAGARGYVTKGDPDALLRAIRVVLEGGIYPLSPTIST